MSQSRRSSSKLKMLPPSERMLLQLPRLGLASEAQLEHLDKLMPAGGVNAIQALLNLMDSGVIDVLIWARESWVGDSVGSVTGVDADKLDLMKPVAMPPTGGCNLMYTEGVLEQMLSQLRDSVFAMSDKYAAMIFNAKDPMVDEPIEKVVHGTEDTVPRQVMMLIQRLSFTRVVQRCVREKRQLATVQRALLATKTALAEPMMDREVPECKRANLVALQQVIHEQFQVVKILADQEKKQADDLERVWKEQVRFYYDDKEQKIEMKMVTSGSEEKVILIGNEYSPPRMLITTEFTHTLRWTYLETMDPATTREQGQGRVLVLIGTSGCGKTGMLANLGQLLGTLPTIIRASEEMESGEAGKKWWKRRLTAAELTGGGPWAPVIISQAHRAPEESLKIAVEEAEKLGLALCLTMTSGPQADKLCKGEGLFAGSTHITVPASAMPVIASGQMAAEGLLKSDELAVSLGSIMETLANECSKQPHYDFGPRTLMQICTQIGYDRRKNTEEKDTVAMVVERCLLPRLAKEDVSILQKTIKANLGLDKRMNSASTSPAGEAALTDPKPSDPKFPEACRLYSVVESIHSITKHEPDVMVLPVPPEGEAAFFESFCKMLNRNAATMVKLDKYLSDYTPEMLMGTMPRPGQDVQDGVLVKLLRKAMDDHVDPGQAIWIVMNTGKCSPEIWECLHELLDDSGRLNLPTGEQLRLVPNLRFLFVMPEAGITPQDTFSRSAVVYTDPATA